MQMEPTEGAMDGAVLGDLRDAQDRTAEAFQAYNAAGELRNQTQGARMGARESGSDQVRRVTAAFRMRQ